MAAIAAWLTRLGATSWIGTAMQIVVGAAIVGVGVYIGFLRLENQTLRAELNAATLKSVVSGLQGQVQDLTLDNVAKQAEAAFATGTAGHTTGVVAAVFTNATFVSEPLRERISYAPTDDAPASVALCDTVERMRLAFDNLARVRTGDDQKAGVPDLHHARRTAETVWRELTCPATQGDFAAATRVLMDDFAENVLKLDGLRAVKADTEHRLKQLNEDSADGRD